MPQRRIRVLIALLILGPCSLPSVAQPTALSVNPSSREEVRQFYRAVYSASENIPPTWTGNYATGNAGDTSAAFKEATRLRINFFRALVGIPADVTFNSAYNAKAQQAALMQSVNASTGGQVLLNHTPPASWTFFTAEGADASAKSNLAYGNIGPAAITSYIIDNGPANAVVGHRRWLFYPQTLQMGTGDVPGDGTRDRGPANATWILDATVGGRFGDPRPATRTEHVAYPPPGFVPHSLVWPRWSFSHPGADFSVATVTMTRNGQPIAAVREPLNTTPTGEPTLVWLYDGRDGDDDTAHARPTADTAYDVTITDVRIGAAVRSFNYRVTVFDPDVAGPDAAPVAIAGPATVELGGTTTFSVAKPTYASAFEWRAVQFVTFAKTYTADPGLDGLLANTTGSYNVVQSAVVATGNAAFHLAHPPDRADQILTLPTTFLVTADSALTFQSRLGIATAAQTARVQISTDGGNSWFDIYRQSGTSAVGTSTPAPTETTFVAHSLPLAAFAGRTIDARLVFSMQAGAAGYQPSAENAVGWFIDNLTVTSAQAVAAAAAPTRIAAGTTFGFAPDATGPIALQARGLIAGAYPLEWGPIHHTTATSADGVSSSYLANLSVRTTAGSGDNTLIVGFRVEGGARQALIRGVGPALAAFGVNGALVDPRLELFGSNGKIAENDNWEASTRPSFGTVGAFDLPPSSRDAVLLQSLSADGYTAQLSGNAGATGIALVELYDTRVGTPAARFVNVSARSQVGTGDNILVAGFTIGGTGSRSLLIRAIGPTLTAFGVAGVLADPKLELFNASSTRIAENDNWDFATDSAFGRVGAFSLTRNSRDAVLIVTLPPGSYTAQISGVNNTTGVALVELYELP